jgi:hypothetical protein
VLHKGDAPQRRRAIVKGDALSSRATRQGLGALPGPCGRCGSAAGGVGQQA